MATYASNSNPFIKSNTCPAGSDSCESSADLGPKRKDAPGMAMLQSQIADKQKIKDPEATTMMHDELVTIHPEPKEQLIPETKVDIIDINSNITEPSEKAAKGFESEFDEITKACESLVETTIKLELQEEASSKRKDLVDDDTLGKPSNSTEQEIGEDKADLCEHLDNDGDVEQTETHTEESGRRQHIELIRKLRLQLRDLERYAYERGELGQVPASVIAERQTVILDALKDRLSLSIDMNEKLELDELKKQVDKEINDLIDPLITKDHLLGQLKTQLTDLERYINYLHGTIGKIHDKSTCTCHVHGCCTKKLSELASAGDGNQTTNANEQEKHTESGTINDEAFPKTSKLIKSLVTQLICSDMKLREAANRVQVQEEKSKFDISGQGWIQGHSKSALHKPPKTEDDAAWTLHIDKVILATDSLVNLFTVGPEYQRPADTNVIDDRLVESIVRRQLVPALRDLLSYGLIDLSSMPQNNSYLSLLFDPYYLLTSLTCFPGSNRSASPSLGNSATSTIDKIHLWNVIEDYYQSRNDPTFKTSSVKTLSQSFDLAPSISGPIKITSKQALLIAIDDVNETLSRSKPNGPESHFRAFIYTALNRGKLATWLRIVFRSKSIIRRFYHPYSFVSQPDRVDKLLSTIEPLNQFNFKLRTDVESIEQFVSAF